MIALNQEDDKPEHDDDRPQPSDDRSDGRYHGREQRGQPCRADEAEFDLRRALDEIRGAHPLILAVSGAADRFERNGVIGEVMVKVELAERFLADVKQRLRGIARTK